jgi:hypothetical protein
MKKIFLSVLLFVGASLMAVEAQSTEQKLKPQTPRKNLLLNWFQVGGGVLMDSDGGFSGATGISWIPTYRFNSAWRMKLSLGAMMGNVGTSGGFLMGDAVLSAIYTEAKPLTLELGGGFQYWDGRRNFHPLFRAGIGYRFTGDPSMVHAINFYYSNVFTPLVTSHQIVGAVSFRF